jgi:hypothetical protein
MNKLKQIIGRMILRWMGYKPPIATKWQKGWVRYFNIISYPKEGWINTFHNYEDQDELIRDLGSVFGDGIWGSMVPKQKQKIVKTK